jgi:hypothetical protein
MSSCWSLVDAFLASLMATVGPDTALVISSDHGGLPYRRQVHLNEMMASVGLLRRDSRGYDLARSAAYYHPSDCGQIVANAPAAVRSGLERQRLLALAREAVERANRDLNAELALREGSPSDPYLAFVHPLADTYPTGDPPGRAREALDSGRAGGHHLSPLTPSPWIDAVIGLWSLGSAWDGDAVPRGNLEVKQFLLGLLDGTAHVARPRRAS